MQSVICIECTTYLFIALEADEFSRDAVGELERAHFVHVGAPPDGCLLTVYDGRHLVLEYLQHGGEVVLERLGKRRHSQLRLGRLWTQNGIPFILAN